jgi:hypothetical protein
VLGVYRDPLAKKEVLDARLGKEDVPRIKCSGLRPRPSLTRRSEKTQGVQRTDSSRPVPRWAPRVTWQRWAQTEQSLQPALELYGTTPISKIVATRTEVGHAYW